MIIMDIDGTISNDLWRRTFLPDYDAYNELCHLDAPMNKHLLAGVDYKDVVFVTARPNKYRDKTVKWIERHFPHIQCPCLFMRVDGDMRGSPEIKVEVLGDRIGEGLWYEITAAYDDRQDVLDAYEAAGLPKDVLHLVSGQQPSSRVPEILRDMASTFEERNRVYGSNYKMVGPIMKVLFPDGVPPEVVHSDQFHLFELKIVKLSRFAISGLTHIDSIHDDAIYSAMIESILLESGESQ